MNEELRRVPLGFRVAKFPERGCGGDGQESAETAASRGHASRCLRARSFKLSRLALAAVVTAACVGALAWFGPHLEHALPYLGARLATGALWIKVAAVVPAKPSSSMPFAVSLGPRARIPANSVLSFSGVPPGVAFSAGRSVGVGEWIVPIAAIAALAIELPAGAAGHFELTLTLLCGNEPTATPQAKVMLVIAP